MTSTEKTGTSLIVVCAQFDGQTDPYESASDQAHFIAKEKLYLSDGEYEIYICTDQRSVRHTGRRSVRPIDWTQISRVVQVIGPSGKELNNIRQKANAAGISFEEIPGHLEESSLKEPA